MIATKIMGNLHEKPLKTTVDHVELDWFEAEKKRLRKRTIRGNEIGIAVDEPLKDGDILYLDDTFCIAVKLTTAPLLKISVRTMEEMGRLCFEIGNRHLSLKIESDNVKIPFDTPTAEYLEGLGFSCEKVIEKFDDFIVCKAHGNHRHNHEE